MLPTWLGGEDETSTTWRRLLNDLPIGIAVAHDAKCERVWLNLAAAEMFGAAAGEEVDWSLASKSHTFKVSSQPPTHASLALLRAISSGEQVRDSALAIDSVAGHRALRQDAWPYVDPVGNVAGCVCSFRLHRDDGPAAATEMQQFHRASPLGIAIIDSSGAVTDVNDAFLEILRYTREEFAALRPSWAELTASNSSIGDAQALDELRTAFRTPLYEKEMLRSDGSPVSVMCSAVSHHSDRFDRATAVIFDLTSMKSAELSLRENETKLRLLNETLEHRVAARTLEAQKRADQLRDLALSLVEAEGRERKRLAQLLHDHFQQILSAAKLKAGMVRRSIGEPALKTSMEHVERLLDDAIAESRSLTAELSPPVLYETGLIAAIESLSRAVEKKSGLKIAFQADARAEPAVEQIRVLLFDAVRELLTNVVEHAQATESNIVLSLMANGKIEIVVGDNGSGFDPQSLFPRARKPGTFGLLEISERLNNVGGEFYVQSNPSGGTRVRMTLATELREQPLAASTASARKPAGSEPASAAAASTGRIRVLVADDHAMFREGLISLLRAEKRIEVIGEAADGQQAVDLARQLRPDVLIVDVSMPKLNGLQVSLLLSNEFPQLKIIGLSMHEGEDMAMAMRAAGASAYLTKGGASDRLVELVTRAVPTTG